MQFLFRQQYDQTVSQIEELKIRYASGTIDACTYRHKRGMILDHYLGVTDRYGNPNLPLMTNRLQRLRSFSLYLACDEVLEEEQRMLLRSHRPPPALIGRSISLLPPARIPHLLQQDFGLLPPPPCPPAPVTRTRRQYEAIQPGNSMLVKPAKAFLDKYFLPYPKVAKGGGTKGRLMYRCKHAACTMLCRLVPVPQADPPLYIPEVKSCCRLHTNHSAREDEILLQAVPVRVLLQSPGTFLPSRLPS
jgi:hypothetical protein